MGSPDKKILEYATGSLVLVKQLKRKAVVSAGPDKKGRYLVTMGTLSMWVLGQEIEAISGKAGKKLPVSTKARIKLPISRFNKEESLISIDLHGLTSDQARERLEELLDKAILQNTSQLEIIHGLGTGIIKKVVHNFLSQAKQINHFSLVAGNPGITMAYL